MPILTDLSALSSVVVVVVVVEKNCSPSRRGVITIVLISFIMCTLRIMAFDEKVEVQKEYLGVWRTVQRAPFD